MNAVDFNVTNGSSSAVANLSLQVAVGGRDHSTSNLTLAAGETQTVPVVIGGYDDLTDITPLTTMLAITPNPGETVRIVRNTEAQVVEGGLVLSLATEAFTRGATGRVRFTLENASDVEIELLTATSTGNQPSPDIRYQLLDADGNVLATQSFKQVLGTHVITLADGRTVARIPAGASFTGDPVDLAIPSGAPSEVTVRLAKVYGQCSGGTGGGGTGGGTANISVGGLGGPSGGTTPSYDPIPTDDSKCLPGAECDGRCCTLLPGSGRGGEPGAWSSSAHPAPLLSSPLSGASGAGIPSQP